MPKKFPGRMTYTQWKRTPFRQKHRILGITLNTRVFRYWRDCDDARCRRARSCQDHECYWRRLRKLPTRGGVAGAQESRVLDVAVVGGQLQRAPKAESLIEQTKEVNPTPE